MLISVSDALSQYSENSVYEMSLTKTALFLEAVRYILANRPASSSLNGASLNFADLRDQEKAAAAHYAGLKRSSNKTHWYTARNKRL